MAYANSQKNGNLETRFKMKIARIGTAEIVALNNEREAVDQKGIVVQSYEKSQLVYANIMDDVDGEAVYGKKRQRHKGRGR